MDNLLPGQTINGDDYFIRLSIQYNYMYINVYGFQIAADCTTLQ